MKTVATTKRINSIGVLAVSTCSRFLTKMN